MSKVPVPDPDKVAANLRSGVYHFHWVRPKDKAIFKAEAYEVFQLLYDENFKVVRQYFLCSKCNQILHTDLGGGNYKLTRHPCYKDHQKNKAMEEDTEDGEKQGKKLDVENFFLDHIFDDQSDSDESDDDDNDENNNENDDDDDVLDAAMDEDGVDDDEQGQLANYLFKFSELVQRNGIFPISTLKANVPGSLDADEW